MKVIAQNLEDFLITGGLPAPWDALERSLDLTENFSAGAKKCAEFFRNTEERFEPAELIVKLFHSAVSPKWLEYFLYCLFDIATSRLQVAQQTLRLRCLRRLFMRCANSCSLSETESVILQEVKSELKINDISQLLACTYIGRKLVTRLVEKQPVIGRHKNFLLYLIETEIRALNERINRISETVDVYNLKEMARILPIVRIFDENAKETSDLAKMIRCNEDIAEPVMSFAYAMRHREFQRWIEKIKVDGELQILYESFTMQQIKMVPTKSLIALSSLCRWIQETKRQPSIPLEWIFQSITIYTDRKFCIDAGENIETIRDQVVMGGAWIDGTVVSGNFSDKLYSQWIGHDMLSKPLEKKIEQEMKPYLSFKDVITMHLHNETLIERLLDNSKVFSASGLVEYIAKKTRSLRVLTKIASTNYLYCGPANNGVPLALLKNPAHIPVKLLKQFLKPSYINTAELRNLSLSDMRPDIAGEIRAYLDKQ